MKKGIALSIVLLLVAVIFATVSVNVSAGGAGLKIRPVAISGSSTALTDFQVEINVIYDPDMRSDFGDVRFEDGGGNQLSYYLASYTASTSAVFHVKVPSIPTTGTTIYMTYGDPGLTDASDGDATYVFFDDFNDGVWTDKWSAAMGSKFTESNGILQVGGGGYNAIDSISTFEGPVTYEFRSRRISRGDTSTVIKEIGGTSIWGKNYVRFGQVNYGRYFGMHTGSTDAFGYHQIFGLPAHNKWFEARGELHDNVYKVHRGPSLDTWDQTLSLSLDASADDRTYKMMFFTHQVLSAVGEWDWVRVMKYADPASIATVGEEIVEPDEAIENLIDEIEGMDLPKGIANSLTSKLENALKSLEKGKDETAINQLDAFINQVEALSGKKMTEAQTDALIEAAEAIIEMIQ